MAKKSTKSPDKIEKVMHEFKEGKLKSGKDGKGGGLCGILWIYDMVTVQDKVRNINFDELMRIM